MGGLKNIHQLYGTNPFQQVKGDTIWERDLQFQTKEYIPYCRFCGNEIINANQDENGHTVDWKWEQTNQMHYRCYLKTQHR